MTRPRPRDGAPRAPKGYRIVTRGLTKRGDLCQKDFSRGPWTECLVPGSILGRKDDGSGRAFHIGPVARPARPSGRGGKK